MNARQIREFARAAGRLAKTDSIDADMLAWYGEALQPLPRPLPDKVTEELRGLVVRRRQLIAMRVAEHNRLESAAPAIRRRIRSHLTWLGHEIDAVDQDLAQRLEAHRTEQLELLVSVPVSADTPQQYSLLNCRSLVR